MLYKAFFKRRIMNSSRLEKLCGAFGVSSAERAAAEIFKESVSPFCSEIQCDRLGSVFAVKKSRHKDAKTLMIASPLDEVGMMISEVKEDGTLAFIQLESVAPSSLLHQRVRILTRDNTCVDGVITMDKKALEDKCEVGSADDLSIRCGLSPEELKKTVHPGDLVGYGNNFCENHGIVMSKALFPRVLNEVTIELLERIQDMEFDFHIAAGCIAQSVIGYRGTKTATYVIRPDAAIALTGYDTAGKKLSLGDGVTVGYYDRQMLPSRRFLGSFVEETGAKAYFGMTGNDGSFIHKTLKGTPAVSAGIPVDNMGSAGEICNLKDADALTDALVQYLQSLDSGKIAAFGFGDEND